MNPIASAAATRRPIRIGSGTGSAASTAISSDVLTRSTSARPRPGTSAPDGARDRALTGAEPVDEPLRVAQRMRILRLRRGQELLEILERLGPLPSASA